MFWRIPRQRHSLWATLRKISTHCPHSEKEEDMNKVPQIQLKLFLSAYGAASVLCCCVTGNPPPLCTAWVIVPAAWGDAACATAEDKLLEVFPQTPHQRGRWVFQGTVPPSSPFCLSAALALPVFWAYLFLVLLGCLFWVVSCAEGIFLFCAWIHSARFWLREVKAAKHHHTNFVCTLVQPLVSSVLCAW